MQVDKATLAPPLHHLLRKCTQQEDAKLRELVAEYGSKKWSLIAQKLGSKGSKQVSADAVHCKQHACKWYLACINPACVRDSSEKDVYGIACLLLGLYSCYPKDTRVDMPACGGWMSAFCLGRGRRCSTQAQHLGSSQSEIVCHSTFNRFGGDGTMS